MTISILNSNIVTAFNHDVHGHKTPAIGTKVIESGEFWARTKDLIRSHDPSKDREPGQHASKKVGFFLTELIEWILARVTYRKTAYLVAKYAIEPKTLSN